MAQDRRPYGKPAATPPEGWPIGTFTTYAEAQAAVDEQVGLPAGSFIEWGGQYQNLARAEQRLTLVIPAVIAAIFALLYAALGSARLAAMVFSAVPLALLLRRERTGAGGSVSIAQSEVMLSHLAAEIAEQSADATSAFEQDAPWGVFGSAGDDQWVAVTVRGDTDWQALCRVIGRPDLAADARLSTRTGRIAERARIEDAVRAWTAERSPTEAMTALQRAGVPAGAALRAAELLDWDYYVARRAFREELHPLWTTPFVMENVVIHSERIADPPMRQAPLLGEQTREIAADLLGLDDEQITELLRSGVLESIQPAEIDGAGV